MSKLVNGIKNLFSSESAGGIILLSCVVISLIIANSPLGMGFEQLLATQVGYHSESIHLEYSILLWINDGLMAVFFLMVGLEIKRELVNGQLSSPKRAIFPFMAAIGGVLFPALIYKGFNFGTETAVGWGIPMATDIAFSLAIINMLGRKVPISLKVFLAALAIVDDLIAILVIAIFYNSDMDLTNLYIALAIFAVLLLFNRLGVKQLYFYLIPGLFIWYFIHHSGIHATIAGVLVAMSIPTRVFKGESESPLLKLEHLLAKPVSFLIMPIFALVNTNIIIEAEMFAGLVTPLGLGIILGLVVGKPLGISIICWITVKLNLADIPEKATYGQIIGVGMLAGIGFTMSIFIAILSFSGQDLILAEAKIAVLLASLVSGLLGYGLIHFLHKKSTNAINA